MKEINQILKSELKQTENLTNGWGLAASLQDRIKDLEEAYFKRTVLEAYKFLFIQKNETYNSDQLKLELPILFEDIKASFPNLSLSELFKYWNLGIRGHYGDFSKISVVQCHSYVKSGLKAKLEGFKLGSLEPIINHKQMEQTTEEGKKIYVENHVRQKYEVFKAYGKVADEFGICHNYFVEKGRIKSDSYLRYIDEATQLVRISYKLKFSLASIVEREIEGKTGQTEIMSTAKELCVNDYFKKFKYENKN